MDIKKDILTTTVSGQRRESEVNSSLTSSVESQSGNATIQIALAVTGALVCSVLLLACGICIKYRRNNAKRKQSVLGQVILGLESPSPFSVAINGQLGRSSNLETYQALDIVTEQPQYDIEEVIDTSGESTTGILEHAIVSRYSDSPEDMVVENQEMYNKKKKSLSLRRTRQSSSTGNLQVLDREMIASFSIDIDTLNGVFRVHLHKLSNLPFKAIISDVYAKVCLYPFNKDGILSSVVQGNECVVFDEHFQFDGITVADLDKYTLRLSFYTRNVKRPRKKDSFVAECFLKCSELDPSAENPIHKELFARTKRCKRRSTSDKLLNQSLGDLFVLLQYQTHSNRMKVFLRKAQNLPKSDRLIGQPVHYVRINVLKNDSVVDFKDTKSQIGYYPVWNEPFLFDISNKDIDSCRLEFLIMRGKRYSKDGVVGHVIIGPTAPKSGEEHWKEMMNPRSIESAKWHAILPVFN